MNGTHSLSDALAKSNTVRIGLPNPICLAEGCLYTDEEGIVKTKAGLLKELQPLP